MGAGVPLLRFAAADVPAGRARPETEAAPALLAAVGLRCREGVRKVLASGRRGTEAAKDVHARSFQQPQQAGCVVAHDPPLAARPYPHRSGERVDLPGVRRARPHLAIRASCVPQHGDDPTTHRMLTLVETLAATFLLGLGSAASPCLLPLYPGFIAYLAGTSGEGSRRDLAALLGLAVLAGVLTTMVLVGAALAVVAAPFGAVLRWSVPATTLLLIALGLILLAGRNPFARLATIRVPVVRNPLAQAYVYGLLLGPVALPCAGPFLVALLAISVGLADGLARLGSFVVYGLGFGLPLVVLAALGSARGGAISRWIARQHDVVFRLAGGLVIVTALYELLASGLLSELGGVTR